MVGVKQRNKTNPLLVEIRLSCTSTLLFTFLSMRGHGFALAMETGSKECTRVLGVAHTCVPGSEFTDIQETAVKHNWRNNLLPFSVKTQNVYSLPF